MRPCHPYRRARVPALQPAVEHALTAELCKGMANWRLTIFHRQVAVERPSARLNKLPDDRVRETRQT